jgi:hypothetical protein
VENEAFEWRDALIYMIMTDRFQTAIWPMIPKKPRA